MVIALKEIAAGELIGGGIVIREGQKPRKFMGWNTLSRGGLAMKGGTGRLMDVYRYGQKVTASGRGSMFGSKPAPCIKPASNTPMSERLEEDMDINCGEILGGKKAMAEMGQAVFELMLATASGKKSKSELLGLGDNEFAIRDIGIMS